jgi:hypothetical protein
MQCSTQKEELRNTITIIMSKDNKGLINEAAAKKLAKLHLKSSPQKLMEAYTKFLVSESSCSNDVLTFLDKCTRSVIHGTMFKDMLPEMYDSDPESEDFREEDPEQSFDPIDKCMDVAITFANISLMFQTVWASGLMYGKAIYESDMESLFETEMKDSIPETPETDELNNILQKLMDKIGNGLKNVKFLDIEYEEEDDETDRGRSGEKDSRDPGDIF